MCSKICMIWKAELSYSDLSHSRDTEHMLDDDHLQSSQ